MPTRDAAIGIVLADVRVALHRDSSSPSDRDRATVGSNLVNRAKTRPVEMIEGFLRAGDAVGLSSALREMPVVELSRLLVGLDGNRRARLLRLLDASGAADPRARQRHAARRAT
jgi:hypothetical protein